MDISAKTVGQALQDAPLSSMIENLGIGIANAQERLDNVAIDATMRLANEMTTMLDSNGNEVTRSLLELGFMPSFYHFTEATLEVSFIASMRVAEAMTVGLGARLGFKVGSAADAEQQFAELDRQEKGLDSEMATKRKEIQTDRDRVDTEVKEQKAAFETLVKKREDEKAASEKLAPQNAAPHKALSVDDDDDDDD